MWRSAVQVCLGLHFAARQCSPQAQAGLGLLGGLAQLARAPALQAGGQRFESVILHFSTVTQVVNGVFKPLGSHLSVLSWNEFFDMLAHKTLFTLIMAKEG